MKKGLLIAYFDKFTPKMSHFCLLGLYYRKSSLVVIYIFNFIKLLKLILYVKLSFTHTYLIQHK